MNIKKSLGKSLRTFRKQKGWTQEEAELHTGVAYRTIQDIESGLSQLTIVTLFKISRAMKIKPGQFLEPVWKEWLKSRKD